MKKYNPKLIEKKWQAKWKASKIFETKDSEKGKKNFMLLTEFPYPSGNLHIGHWFAFAVPDILARYYRLIGLNVMYPMGFDAFGLPAENAAIKRGLDPGKWTEQNIRYMTEQFATMGASFDWPRKVSTIDPEYYKWTQWIFLRMLEKDLAYKSETTVNWCPSCKTVLANEQVVNGVCERCDTNVEQKKMDQWLYRTTKYADQLVDDLEKLDWPESTKLAQKNWIGRSEGTTIKFKIQSSKSKVKEDYCFEAFTTRIDTIYGCTYCVLAPEHPLIENSKAKIENIKEIEKYIAKAKKKTELQRTEMQKEKTGVELKGVQAINPFTNEAVPIFVADYVLGHYGTGAVMAVPAHDERDFEFAMKYKLPIKDVIESGEKDIVGVGAIIKLKNGKFLFQERDKKTDASPGMIAPFGGGIKSGENQKKALRRELKEELKVDINDSIFSHIGIFESDNFPGKKISIYYINEIDEKSLKIKEGKGCAKLTFSEALKNPRVTDFTKRVIKYFKDNSKFTYTDDGILLESGKYSGLTSEKAREEMTKWLEKNNLGKKTKNFRLHDWVISRQRYWGVPIPVVYCEKCGLVPVPEKDLPVKLPPLKDFLPTGDGKSPLAKAEKWVQMKCPKCGGAGERETDTMDTFVDSSWYFLRYTDPKNKKRFADPVKMKKWLPVPLYVGGAEHNTMHLLYSRFFTKVLHDLGYIHFNEPFTGRRNHGNIFGPDNQKMSKSRGNVIDPDEQVKKWGADSVRLYLAFMGPYDQNASWQMTGIVGTRRFLERVWKLRAKIKEQAAKNSTLDSLLHKTIKKVSEDIRHLHFNTAISTLMILLNELEKQDELSSKHYSQYIVLLSPFAPHIAEEIWSEAGNKKSIFLEKWPEYDPRLVKEDEMTLIIQVNGKVRDELKISAEMGERDVRDAALGSEKIKKYIPYISEIKKVIFVPGRLINFVV